MARISNPLTFLTSPSRPALVAMIHVGALPGTPRAFHGIAEVADQAVREAVMLAECGVDAIMLENMHDVPYLNRQVGPEIVAAMTRVCRAVRQAVKLPLGVQVLAGANREALAVALAADCQFVRCEGFVFAHVADEGLMGEADAGPLLRYRRTIGAESIAIIADVKKKHSAHALTKDVSLVETAKAAEFFGADGVVITGTATGVAADAKEVRDVKNAVTIPVFVGSGVTPENVGQFTGVADALIVGSSLKSGGHWANAPDPARVKQMIAALHK